MKCLANLFNVEVLRAGSFKDEVFGRRAVRHVESDGSLGIFCDKLDLFALLRLLFLIDFDAVNDVCIGPLDVFLEDCDCAFVT